MIDNEWDITIESVYEGMRDSLERNISDKTWVIEDLEELYLSEERGYIRNQLKHLNKGLDTLSKESNPDSKIEMNICLTRLKEEILVGLYLLNKYMKSDKVNSYVLVNLNNIYTVDINDSNKVVYYRNGDMVEPKDLDFLNTGGSIYNIDAVS